MSTPIHSITDDELTLALVELEAEQRAWREAQQRDADALKARMELEQRQRLRAIRRVGNYLARQERRLARF